MSYTQRAIAEVLLYGRRLFTVAVDDNLLGFDQLVVNDLVEYVTRKFWSSGSRQKSFDQIKVTTRFGVQRRVLLDLDFSTITQFLWIPYRPRKTKEDKA